MIVKESLPILIDKVSDAWRHYSVQFSREFIRTEALYDAEGLCVSIHAYVYSTHTHFLSHTSRTSHT